MKSEASFQRPSLREALEAWRRLLAERGFATDLVWIFAENLCVERSDSEPGGLRVGFQTRFTPPPEDAVEIAFSEFSETDKPIVFYRLGERSGKSVCLLLCDAWFENRGETDGFVPRDQWKIFFHPGGKEKLEEVTDLTRWLHRVKRDRAFHDFDFCMSLEAIDEIKIYGRTLVPYERFAATMFNRLRRVLGQPA